MIELALLLGLGAVGYALAIQQQPTMGEDGKHREDFTVLQNSDNVDSMNHVVHTQHRKGHNNEVPFFIAGKFLVASYSEINFSVIVYSGSEILVISNPTSCNDKKG